VTSHDGFGGPHDSLGSGFIIRTGGVVITNWHVIQGASRALVILASRDSVDQVAAFGGDCADWQA